MSGSEPEPGSEPDPEPGSEPEPEPGPEPPLPASTWNATGLDSGSSGSAGAKRTKGCSTVGIGGVTEEDVGSAGPAVVVVGGSYVVVHFRSAEGPSKVPAICPVQPHVSVVIREWQLPRLWW